MKTQTDSILNMMLFSLLLLFSFHASAYYDPGVQRWINRDPLSETGFELVRLGNTFPRLVTSFYPVVPNLYRFCEQEPTDRIDRYGLSPCTETCDDDARSNLRKGREIAKCAAAGGAALGGFLGARGGGLKGALGLAAIWAAANFVFWDLLGDAYALDAWLGCRAGCASVEGL